MRDNLVAVEVEIDPFIARPTFAAAHHSAIKRARGGEIIDREGEVERGKGHRQGSLLAPS
jgi:hypothetical protein